jgi:hypothetical protein
MADGKLRESFREKFYNIDLSGASVEGDQMGRSFSIWAIVYLGNYRSSKLQSSQNFALLFSQVKVVFSVLQSLATFSAICAGFWAIFSLKHLVTVPLSERESESEREREREREKDSVCRLESWNRVARWFIFKPKSPIRRALDWKMLTYFTVIRDY